MRIIKRINSTVFGADLKYFNCSKMCAIDCTVCGQDLTVLPLLKNVYNRLAVITLLLVSFWRKFLQSPLHSHLCVFWNESRNCVSMLFSWNLYLYIQLIAGSFPWMGAETDTSKINPSYNLCPYHYQVRSHLWMTSKLGEKLTHSLNWGKIILGLVGSCLGVEKQWEISLRVVFPENDSFRMIITNEGLDMW